MSLLWIIFITGFIGIITGWFFNEIKKKQLLIETQTLLNKTIEEKEKLEEEIKNLQVKHLHAEKQLSEMAVEKKTKQILQNQFTDHFKNLSQEILENKSKQFQIQAEKNLSTLLSPLKEKILTFQTKVEETYNKESRERFSLKDKIKELCEVHDRLKEETMHLSKALKGDIKAQGQWGEIILSTILEASGLKENEHYITQGRNLKLKDEEGNSQKPDVIIKLPDNKHIVIDAKVSLTHYERFIVSNSETEKQNHLSQFISSLHTHVVQLSKKQYSLTDNLNTPDFVLMFFPVEGAFSLALQSNPKIFQFSWKHSIVIVSPTTLLATLKTVESIWKREKQNRNAREIAKASGLLYDKFTSFTEDLSQIGSNLKKQKAVITKLFKITHGKRKYRFKTGKIKELGARTSKQIPDNLLPLDKQT